MLHKVEKLVRADCHSRFGEHVAVRVTVEAATGALRERKVLPPHDAGSQVSLCIVAAIDRAQFPSFTGQDYTVTMDFEVTPQPPAK